MSTQPQFFPNANPGRAARALHADGAAALDVPAPVRPQACPVERWLEFLGHRWNALILWHLRAPRRHGELAALLPGITPKVLAERLSALAGRGLVARTVGAGFPRTVAYAVTPRGTALLAVLDGLELWARSGDGEPGAG